MKTLKQLQRFFSSVQLAIFSLCALATTSIIGTLIPQGESTTFYINKFGPTLATFMQLLDIPKMYSSWWFISLLVLLTLNLIVCSIDRFPFAWRLIQQDNFSIPFSRLMKMQFSHKWEVTRSDQFDKLTATLEKAGWNGERKQEGQNSLFFAQKGRWSRLGVYIVHLSVLVIFLGALVGHLTGFRASVMLPEGKATNTVYNLKNQQAINLDFTVFCNSFLIDFYNNGMPKEYRSNLSIVENNELVLHRDIVVNSPLKYKGVTFYQASYQGYQDFLVTITENNSDVRKAFQIPFRKDFLWQDHEIRFGILNIQNDGMRILREKLWYKIGENPAKEIWLDDNTTTTVTDGEKTFTIKVKQLYATGLQVTKDSGVWVVYIGCLLMLIGLYMTFFMSHRRLWVYLLQEDGRYHLLLTTHSNKNRQAMEKETSRLKSIVQTSYPPISGE